MSQIKYSNVTVMVSDMDQAIRFYTEVVGLPAGKRYDNHWAEIQAPGMLIGLHPNTGNVVSGNNLSIGLAVDHFDEAVRNLEQKGVTCQIKNDGWSKLAYFADPDGNVLYFSEIKW
jgi:catechol 2,3-dioxygenase-like lactoylglutathione lyase family enzyme